MIPVGYMAKRVCGKLDWLQAPQVLDVYSVSPCISEDFADFINYWKHNGYWLFDSPEIIRNVAQANAISLDGTALFYYEVFENEFLDGKWKAFAPEASFLTNVLLPLKKQLEGFDVVTFYSKTSPECSPLSCNHLAKDIPTNAHCLLKSFEEAQTALESGAFRQCEPGPYRIFAVYSVDW